MLLKFLPKTLTLCAGFCLCAASAAQAADESARPDTELRTSDVFVTAAKVEQDLLDVPMSVSVITEDDVRHSGARTVGELLRDVPGVEIINSGGQGFNRIQIRGEDAKRVLILIDGQKIAENKAMDGPPLLIDPSRIERVEVIRGPASVLYGSEAIGGVVNIITRKGGTSLIQGEVGVQYSGANDGTGANATLFGSYEGFNYRASASYGDYGDRDTPEGRARNSRFRQTDASVFLSYDFDHLTIGGGYDYFDSTLHSGSRLPGYENFRVDLPEWEREKFYAFAEFTELADWLPRLRLDAFTQENHKFMYNDVDTDPTITGMPANIFSNADNTNTQYGASLQADWALGDNHYLITGYEFNRDKIEADTHGRGETDAARLLAAGIPSAQLGMMLGMLNYSSYARHEGHQDSHALYGQMESSLPMDFTLNYGMRYTWVRTNMDTAYGTNTATLTGITKTENVGETGTENNSRPVFNLGVMWSGIDKLTLRATFAQGFRVPTIQERYIRTTMGGETILPNPGLNPEKSTTYELGARYADNGLVLDAAVFYTDADDYIASLKVGSGRSTTNQFFNVASATSYGLELSASYDFPFGLTPYVTATLMRRKFDFGDHSTWNTGTPRFYGRSGLRYSLDITPDVRFYADVYARFSTVSRSESSTGVVTSHSAWQTANLSAGLDFGSEKQFTLGAEVLNLFDRKYAYNTSILEPGMHANLFFSYRF